MRKRYCTLYVCLCFGLLSYGQDNIKRISTINNFLSHTLLENLEEYSGNYLYIPMVEYTASSLFFNYDSGDFKQGNEPETVYDFGLSTQGLYRNKNGMVFFGKFAIKKEYYQDLRWNLSYQMPEKGLMPDPHYFGVSKGASWSNQEYNLHGGMVLPLFHDKLHFVFKTEYSVFNKYRSDYDPRPKITYNDLGFQAGVNFQVSKKQHIKVGAEYGYMHVHNEIVFSNNNKNQPVNYDIYVKWIAGYGSLTGTQKNTTKRRDTRTGFNLGYAYTSDKTTLLLDIKYQNLKRITYKDANIEDENDLSTYFATYNPKIFKANLVGIHFLNREKLLKAELKTTHMQATNFWTDKGGKTYSAGSRELSLNLAYLKQKNQITSFDIGAQAGIWQVDQRDALVSTSIDFSNLEFGVYGLKSFRLNQNLILSPYLKLNFRKSLSSNFINGNKNYLENIGPTDYAGLATKDYYTQVIYPNLAMYSANEFEYMAGTSLHINPLNKLNTLLNLKVGKREPLQSLQYFEVDDPMRWYTSLSLTLIY